LCSSVERSWYGMTIIPWNKGKKCPQLSGTNNPMYGVHLKHTEKEKEKIRQASIIMWQKKKESGEVALIGQKISESQTGKKRTLEQRKRISLGHMGNTNHKGHKHSKESRQQMSDSLKKYYANGGVPWIKGRKHSKKSRCKLSVAMQRRLANGYTSPMKGKKHSRDTIEKLRIINAAKAKHGSESHCWRGGISFEPYGLEWTDTLKLAVKQRDGFTCRLCGKNKDRDNIQCNVHHIDYVKTHNEVSNLITLCRGCHSKTNNGDRNEWTEIFHAMIAEQGMEA